MIFVALIGHGDKDVRYLIFLCYYCKDRYSRYNPKTVSINPFWVNCGYCGRAAGHVTDIREFTDKNKLIKKSYLTIPSKTTQSDIKDLVFNRETQNFEIKSEVVARVVMDPNRPPGSVRYRFIYTPADVYV